MNGILPLLILHLADREPVYGRGISRMLKQHGFPPSPGVLYPLLNNLAEQGLLETREETVAGRTRKYYATTPRGRDTLATARGAIGELIRQVFAGELKAG